MLLCHPGFGREVKDNTEKIKSQVSRIQPGRKVVVKLLNKEKVKGVLVKSGETGLEVVTTDKSRTQRSIAYGEIKGVGTPMQTWQVVVITVAITLGVLMAIGLGLSAYYG